MSPSIHANAQEMEMEDKDLVERADSDAFSGMTKSYKCNFCIKRTMFMKNDFADINDNLI